MAQIELGFSLRKNSRTYGIYLRERNWPAFQGYYNVYVSVYGQLSGEFMGWIEEPLLMDVTANAIYSPFLLSLAEQHIAKGYKNSIW